jgi:feruloyl esterase
MKAKNLFVLLTLCIALLLVLSAQPFSKGAQAADDPCASLMDLKLPETKILVAESLNAPVVRPSGLVIHNVWKAPKSAHGQATVPTQFCRVAGVIDPAINFEVWLPVEGWNGKFNGVGNGALAGGINYPAMVAPLAKGYAVMSTDTGHQSETIVDGAWMMGRPDLWDDFGYRAMHLSTRNAKDIIEAYYGNAPEYSYYTGCSGGGQEGLAEAQKYPADYDGVAVGAPANFPTRMWPGETYPGWVAYKANTQESLGGPPGPPMVTPKLAALHEAALAACDDKDGVKDGVISDPASCEFDPATLLCPADPEDPNKCLTQAEVDTVTKIYAGLKDPTTGEQFWPGYAVGSEENWAGHIYPFVIPLGYFRAMVFNDPEWDYKSFDFENPEDFATLVEADARNAPYINATDPDLTAFNELGGKMILWHGWADQNIAPQNSINYYNNVVEVVGDETQAQEFMRLFMVPGMGHCSGGAGPTTFDALAALEKWVEEGVAPTELAGAHMTSGKVDFTRPICMYPQVAVYSGTGSETEAENYTCTAP